MTDAEIAVWAALPARPVGWLSQRSLRSRLPLRCSPTGAPPTNEALALFVRFWLNATPPLPDEALPAAQAQGLERYDGFVEALTRRMEFGQRLTKEILSDVTRK